MERMYAEAILRDLPRKAVLLSGPRQCGKTYFAKSFQSNFEYLNFDIMKDRKKLLKFDWNRKENLVIFDELHKMKKWKSWLKGIIDDPSEKQQILVTGSAKLNTYRKVGDSLAGRFFSHRIYPLDVKEVISALRKNKRAEDLQFLTKGSISIEEVVLDRLLLTSGFPEPFLTEEEGFYNRWKETHLDIILKQDVLELESVKNIKQLETLSLLLAERVGSILSYNSLREDLSTDDKSIKRWVDILENSFVHFRVYPYVHQSIITGIRKAPKLYFFDYCRVENYSSRLENLVALSLLKEIHFRFDVHGKIYGLHYLRNKQKKEIDFLITKSNRPHMMIEVKESDDEASENFKTFEAYFPKVQKIQLVKNLKKERLAKSGVLICPMAAWLSEMEF